MMKELKPDSMAGQAYQLKKQVAFRYKAPLGLATLLEQFRSMCNDAIRLALAGRPNNRFALQAIAYGDLKNYGLHTHYILAACEVAYSIYKNGRRRSKPLVKRAFLKLDSQSYQLNHLIVRIPARPKQFLYLTLEGSDYHLSFVDDRTLKHGQITITEKAVYITFTKTIVENQTKGRMGIDVNEANVTWSDTMGNKGCDTSLAQVVELKQRYREIRAMIAKKTKGDVRIQRKLLAKYGLREQNRSSQVTHKISKEIADYANSHKLGIVMEDLKGIRKLYRKGNRQGSSFRDRMNSWVFGETQHRIDYKVRWEGNPVWYINPRGSSSYCPGCGSRVVPLPERKLLCAACDKVWDRDDLASKNLMACVVPQGRPPKGSHEGERGGDGSNPQSGWGEVKIRLARATA